MIQNQWDAVDEYFNELFVPFDPALDSTIKSTAAAGMPMINVAPNQGKLLHLLARSHKVSTVLEIGTLAGYSTIWLARAVQSGGRVITLEIDPRHAEVARNNFASAGLSATVEVRVGSAHDTLPELAMEGAGPFDLVFIDADKASTPVYVEWAMKLTQPGSLIIIDNVVRNGQVSNAQTVDENVKGIRTALRSLAHDPRVVVTALQTVGSKGYDGLALVLRVG